MSDLISRADAIEAVRICVEENSDFVIPNIYRAISEIPSVETWMSYRDLISRFDAIDKAKEIIYPLLDDMDYDDTASMAHVCIAMKIKILDMLHALPSAEVVSREDYHNLLMASNDIDRALREYQAKDESPSAKAEKKKAELKENGDWDCPDVGCDECDHHRSVEWCSLAIPNHEKEIDETYKMVNEAFFEGFNAAEKRYRFLIEYVEELDKKLAEAEWIPCSERVPDVDVEVLTTTDWSDVLIAWIGKGGAWETEEHILDNDEILAWMPLPKPYKAESEVEE